MDNIKIYYENTQKPWGKLFYQTVWNQLSFVKDMRVMDFGSGFGITANFLASQNDVIAIELNKKMCEMNIQENYYQQIVGGLEQLEQFPSEAFDVIICHNVLEYVENIEEYIQLFSRLLKKDGILSLVKHNHYGRTMQRVIFENNLDLAMLELKGQSVFAQNFGEVNYYTESNLNTIAEKNFLKIQNILGVRTFFGLVQNNEVKNDEHWQEKMLDIELKVSNIEEFKNISFFQHVILKKQVLNIN